VLAATCWAASASGGVARQGVAFTDLESLGGAGGREESLGGRFIQRSKQSDE
jgi:hypothetical protein